MTPSTRKPGAMSELRRSRIRLEISREAARLFWAQGVAGTSGEQIAASVGLSVRTLWRHFRTKESCAEPIVAKSAEWFVAALRRWPRELSIEDHLAATRAEIRRTPEETADDLAGVRMVVLGDTEPALRSAWLMTCDHVEKELAAVIADRLGRPAGDVEVRTHAAAAGGAMRVLNESLGPAVLSGEDLSGTPDPFQSMARAVRVATSGIVGDPVDS
ncbi:TetR/AcrR family transcriptional regulator [Amycolatopsis sp. NPDC058986]|uniref:TetR/AcrR family transcriptional regulator n=1 Tax=unclassified Amycolatopsis TaxID=2618356 RepID=UPI00366B5B34